MHDKECSKLLAKLIFILRQKEILDDEDMEKLFGKPEEIRLIDRYKI